MFHTAYCSVILSKCPTTLILMVTKEVRLTDGFSPIPYPIIVRASNFPGRCIFSPQQRFSHSPLLQPASLLGAAAITAAIFWLLSHGIELLSQARVSAETCKRVRNPVSLISGKKLSLSGIHNSTLWIEILIVSSSIGSPRYQCGRNICCLKKAICASLCPLCVN